MNLLSFFVFLIAGQYLENVMSATVGVRKSLWFPLTKQFWCGSKNKERGDNKVANSSEEDSLEEKQVVESENFEDIHENLRRKEDDNKLLKIQGLKKKFGDSF